MKEPSGIIKVSQLALSVSRKSQKFWWKFLVCQVHFKCKQPQNSISLIQQEILEHRLRTMMKIKTTATKLEKQAIFARWISTTQTQLPIKLMWVWNLSSHTIKEPFRTGNQWVSFHIRNELQKRRLGNRDTSCSHHNFCSFLQKLYAAVEKRFFNDLPRLADRCLHRLKAYCWKWSRSKKLNIHLFDVLCADQG